MNNGMSEYWRAFKGIDGRRLIKEVDVEWMERHGIPHGFALHSNDDIERLRKKATEAGILEKIWWRF